MSPFKKTVLSAAMAAACLLGPAWAPAAPPPDSMGPLRRHPDNPRYFMDGTGKAVYLTGSHVWSNLQDSGNAAGTTMNFFDNDAYMDFLQDRNHNFIRLWNWEHTKWDPAFLSDNIRQPHPFARTSGQGNALDGKPKFNLDQYNQVFFDRLRSRVLAARERGFYISVMMFCGGSIDNIGKGPGNPWPGHPFHAQNNINGINGDVDGDGQGEESHTLMNPAVTRKQEAYVRKVIDAVNDFDNIVYEIANESGGLVPESTQWQYYMINFIKDYMASKGRSHPVGMTAQYPNANDSQLFSSPADWISPSGSSYKDNPPAADLRKVIISDTDHLWGEGGESPWVWKSFTRGLHTIFMDGGIHSSFPATDDHRESARIAMGQTLSYAKRMNLGAMTPQGGLTSTGYALAKTGSEYLIYAPSGGSFTVNLAAGTYNFEWFNPESDNVAGTGSFTASNGNRSFTPPFGGHAVLYLNSGTASFDFSLTDGGNKSVTQGSSVTSSISTALNSGSAQSVSFSVAGLPSGVMGGFSPTSCSPGCSTTLTLNASAAAALGIHSVTVSAQGGGVTRSDSFNLTVAGVPSGNAQTFYFEAESGTLTPVMAAADDPSASQGRYIWTPGSGRNDGPGKAEYSFTVTEAGAFRVWARMIGTVGNSFYISMDGAPRTEWHLPGEGTWTWSPKSPEEYFLSAGAHALSMERREDGTKLDRLAISSDPDFVPTDDPVSNPPPARPLGFRFQ